MIILPSAGAEHPVNQKRFIEARLLFQLGFKKTNRSSKQISTHVPQCLKREKNPLNFG